MHSRNNTLSGRLKRSQGEEEKAGKRNSTKMRKIKQHVHTEKKTNQRKPPKMNARRDVQSVDPKQQHQQKNRAKDAEKERVPTDRNVCRTLCTLPLRLSMREVERG